MPMDWFPLWLSLRVAGISTMIALAAGLSIAHLLANREFRGKELLDAVITLPLILPTTVLAYYLLVLLGQDTFLGRLYESAFGAPLLFTWKAAVVAALIHAMPLLIKMVRAALESVDQSCERAARTMGASEWRIFWKVSVPLAGKPILAAATLAFARSLGDFGITLMIAGNIPGKTQTLAVAVYDAVQAGNTAPARLLVIVISLAVLSLLYLSNRLGPRRVAG